MFRPLICSLMVVALSLHSVGCRCDDAQSTKKAPSAVGSASAAAKSSLPPGVDSELLGRIRDLAMSCNVDVRKSSVECKNRNLDKLSEQFAKGARSQSKSFDTLAYLLTSDDEKIITVTSEVMQRAFRVPVDEKDAKPTSKQTALSLLESLRKLPDQQAVDAAPAVVFATFRAGAENELYQTIEGHKYQRLIPRAYRYLMAAGGMRAWEKVQELAKKEKLEIATAALEAPSLMKQRSAEDSAKICDWYKTMREDSRQVVADRASSYLVACGPAYIEPLLAAAETALQDKTVKSIALNGYQQMCVPSQGVVNPTPEQCQRLKKLLNAVIADTRFASQTRGKAVTLFALNFPEDDTLTVLKKYSKDRDPVIAANAAEGATQLAQDIEKREQGEAPAVERASDNDEETEPER
jgi:hypothetical protein